MKKLSAFALLLAVSLAFACAVKPGYAAAGLVKLPSGVQDYCYDFSAIVLRAGVQKALKDGHYKLGYIEGFKVSGPSVFSRFTHDLGVKLAAQGYSFVAYNQEDGPRGNTIRSKPGTGQFFAITWGPSPDDDGAIYVLLSQYSK